MNLPLTGPSPFLAPLPLPCIRRHLLSWSSMLGLCGGPPRTCLCVTRPFSVPSFVRAIKIYPQRTFAQLTSPWR